MDYSKLVEVYEELGSTTKRLAKTDILVELFKKSSKDDLIKIVNLVQGKVFPDYDERKIGFSSRLIIKAINSASGISTNEIEKLWSKTGDLGKVTEILIKKKTQATLFSKKLTIDKVFSNIRKLAELEGTGTVNKKISLVSELLTSAKPKEARFIVGTILEELRVGIKAGVVRDTIAKSFNLDVKQVEESYNLLGDYAEVAALAKEHKLKKVTLKSGRPLKLMLAILVKDMEEGFKSLGKPAQLEYKLDGFRLEIHKDNKEIKLFTRRLENVTKQFPDVVKCVKENVKGKSFIIDAEAVSYNRETGKHLPFQNISQRIKRKYNIEKMAKDFPVELNVFDIIYYNKKNLMNTTLKDRRKILEKIIKQKKGQIVLTKKLVTDDLKKANTFYEEALKNGNEGLMIKNLNSNYKPGRYVNGWCKLKPTLENLDLVIVKAEYGEGKRATWLSSYTVACNKNNELLEVGKVSTGVKEKSGEGVTYNELTKLLKPLITKQKGKQVIVKPKIVIEVGYEEIQKSPTYTSGFALRFPRVKRLRIKEKSVKDINTIEDVKRIYSIQRK